MPFKPVMQLPNRKPSVRIFLTGQLLVQPNAESTACEVFVNRSAANHHLTIEVREKFDTGPDFILMRHYGPLEFLDSRARVGGLDISRVTEAGPAIGNVSAYTGAPTAYGEAMSAIDLSDREFHPNKQLTIDFECARPSIMISDGIFNTAAKTATNLEFTVKRGTKTEREIPSFASIIGANIYLDGEDGLRITWNEMGLPRNLTLRKPVQGLTYEIYIINDPLYDDVLEAKAHDEFSEYYKVVTNVPTNERVKMEMKVLDQAPERGSAKTPCMPVVVGTGG